MYTEVIKLNNENYDYAIKLAGKHIRRGNIVIFPTETVYGIGANALDEDSSKKIYMAKGRPSDNPLIVHIENMDDLNKISKKIDERTKKIIDCFWPGPLTIIVEKSEIVPSCITGGLNTVAVRMPSNKIARDLIKKSGVPIAAPSANISGRPSITSEKFITDEFFGKVDLILLNESTEIGIESTVIDVTGENIVILRPGFITKNDLENLLAEKVIFDLNISDETKVPKSPGMKYRHYAPKCELYLISGSINMQIDTAKNQIANDIKNGIKSIVLGLDNNRRYFENYLDLGNSDIDVAKNIFTNLRMLDIMKIQKAYFLYEVKSELDFSILDRVKKAAGYKII